MGEKGLIIGKKMGISLLFCPYKETLLLLQQSRGEGEKQKCIVSQGKRTVMSLSYTHNTSSCKRQICTSS
jgi:hypothetical protein